MKSTDAINAIRTLLGMEVKLAQMKLENGTVLEAEAFEADYEVFIVTEDEKVALPVGEYALEDGKILVVQEEGLIAEIKEVSGEEEVEAPAEEMAAEEYATKAELAEIKAMVEEIYAAIKKAEEMKAEELAAQPEPSVPATIEEEVAAQVEAQLSQEPAAAPLKHNPEGENQKQMFKLSPNRNLSTRDRVFQKIANL